MRRTSSTIPFGYRLDAENEQYVVEIPEQLEALNKIIPLIKERTLSLREGSMWIEHETGRSLSHMGLKKIADRHAS
jgi:hypothetical protein|tara:strand:+ start:368 stop:595 length:228 start_codon:yes stop_codon:yes gene_type:complete